MTDDVMGSWTYTYDSMNRLASATANAGVDKGLMLGWTYDRYGNRWAQNATGTGNASAVRAQLTFFGNTNRIDGWSYSASGNLLNDQIHTYTYDAENRIATLNGEPEYIYDAEGRRVAKTNSSGVATAVYVLGLGGEQVSELNGSGAWVHSNVFAGGGRLLASYEGPAGTDTAGYHYHLTDWLGTKRMQTTAAGNQEETCMSYPFGDGLSCTGGPDATEHHFTGKERDAESGLDYFRARYLTSDLGRFMTPDWAAAPTAVPYAAVDNPQTLNLYAYVGNDPNTRIDVDGHCGGLSNCNPDWWNPPFGFNSGPAPGWDGNFGQPTGGDAAQSEDPFVSFNEGSEMAEGEARFEYDLTHPDPLDLSPQELAAKYAARTEAQKEALANELAKEAAEKHISISYEAILGMLNAVQTVGGNTDFEVSTNPNDPLRQLIVSLGLTTGGTDGCEMVCRSGGFANSPHFDHGMLHMDTFNAHAGPFGIILHGVVDVLVGSMVYGDMPFPR